MVTGLSAILIRGFFCFFVQYNIAFSPLSFFSLPLPRIVSLSNFFLHFGKPPIPIIPSLFEFGVQIVILKKKKKKKRENNRDWVFLLIYHYIWPSSVDRKFQWWLCEVCGFLWDGGRLKVLIYIFPTSHWYVVWFLSL